MLCNFCLLRLDSFQREVKKVVKLKILKIKRAVEEEKTVKLYNLVNVQMLFFSVI